MAFQDLTDAQKESARSLGYVGLFAERESVQDAYDYAMGIARRCGDAEAHVTTAIHVLVNTYAVATAEKEPRRKGARLQGGAVQIRSDALSRAELGIFAVPDGDAYCSVALINGKILYLKATGMTFVSEDKLHGDACLFEEAQTAVWEGYQAWDREVRVENSVARIEAQVVRDFAEVEGKEFWVTSLVGFVGDDSGEYDRIDPPARVRIVRTEKDDLRRWCDDWCDPCWNAVLVDTHSRLRGVRSIYIYGTSYNAVTEEVRKADIVPAEDPVEQFEMGRLVMTRGVADAIMDTPSLSDYVNRSILRHNAGDWGDVVAEDAHANDEAIRSGERLLSVYKYEGQPTFWIITEADRSATTVLRPEEY